MADSIIHPLLKIGGCYTYEIKKDSIAGVLLAGISRNENVDYYYFLLSGKIFNTQPTAEEFREAGIWGRKIPHGSNFTVDFNIGFKILSMDGNTIANKLHKFRLADSIPISKKIDEESSGATRSPDLIGEEFKFIEVFNKRQIEEYNKSKQYGLDLPRYPAEIFPFSQIPLATNKSELSIPHIVWRLSPKTAHPASVNFMNEEWWWDEADDFSPFGSDDGSDAFYGFKTWREKNSKAEPAAYILELEKDWGISFAHLEIEKEEDLQAIENSNTFYRNVDRSIIAVSLGQIALEGSISPKLKSLGIKAIKRARTDFGLNGMDDEDKIEYRKRLDKMKDVLNNF